MRLGHDCWHEAGAEPWTIRRITEVLRQLEWPDAEMQNAWLYIRAWLLNWSQVRRVGQDYWIPIDQLPQEIQRTRLQVLPLRVPDPQAEVSVFPLNKSTASTKPIADSHLDESQVVLRGEVTTNRASWNVRLRTVNLLEGFLHIPAVVRGVYPSPVPGEE